MDDLWGVVRSDPSIISDDSSISNRATADHEKETALQMQNDEKENEKQRVEIPPISRYWGGKVANAKTCRGRKANPSPAPCTAP
jgi:hypothetical protein